MPVRIHTSYFPRILALTQLYLCKGDANSRCASLLPVAARLGARAGVSAVKSYNHHRVKFIHGWKTVIFLFLLADFYGEFVS
jgi:hypothetical protein